jgi:hypothetical protein
VCVKRRCEEERDKGRDREGRGVGGKEEYFKDEKKREGQEGEREKGIVKD